MKRYTEPGGSESPDQLPLSGGSCNDVVRIRDTVRRRSAGHDVVYELLEFLEERQFPASRFLGIDAQGREVLSYEEGEVGNYPIAPALQGDDVLVK